MLSNLAGSDIVAVVVSMLVSIPLHEAMHGFAAHALGDNTAEDAGRLSLNPLKHIDLTMTILLPIFLILIHVPPIFVAKPVPIDSRNLKYDEFGMAIVGLAGPLTNLLLAFAGALVLHMLDPLSGLANGVVIFMQVNILLFVFNLIPFPPLDGSRLLYAVAPDPVRRIMDRIEGAGFAVTIIALLILMQFISPIIGNISQSIFNFLLR